MVRSCASDKVQQKRSVGMVSSRFRFVIEDLLKPFSRDERSGEQETRFTCHGDNDARFNSGVIWTLEACGLIQTVHSVSQEGCLVSITLENRNALQKLIGR